MEGQTESELDRLAALQEFDRHVKEKLELVASLEQEITEMESQLSAQREMVASTRADRQTRERQRRELEIRLEDEEEKIKDRRMRLNRVRNEKELNALRREIEVGKEANQRMETELLTEMQAVEMLDAQLSEGESTLSSLEEEFSTKLVANRRRIETLRAELAAERVERDRIADSLSGALRSKYEQIFSRHGRTTVVEVRNGTCLGCHMHVPPQLFNELQKTRAVRMCPNCHRILYWRPEPNDGKRE